MENPPDQDASSSILDTSDSLVERDPEFRRVHKAINNPAKARKLNPFHLDKNDGVEAAASESDKENESEGAKLDRLNERKRRNKAITGRPFTSESDDQEQDPVEQKSYGLKYASVAEEAEDPAASSSSSSEVDPTPPKDQAQPSSPLSTTLMTPQFMPQSCSTPRLLTNAPSKAVENPESLLRKAQKNTIKNYFSQSPRVESSSSAARISTPLKSQAANRVDLHNKLHKFEQQKAIASNSESENGSTPPIAEEQPAAVQKANANLGTPKTSKQPELAFKVTKRPSQLPSTKSKAQIESEVVEEEIQMEPMIIESQPVEKMPVVVEQQIEKIITTDNESSLIEVDSDDQQDDEIVTSPKFKRTNVTPMSISQIEEDMQVDPEVPEVQPAPKAKKRSSTEVDTKQQKKSKRSKVSFSDEVEEVPEQQNDAPPQPDDVELMDIADAPGPEPKARKVAKRAAKQPKKIFKRIIVAESSGEVVDEAEEVIDVDDDDEAEVEAAPVNKSRSDSAYYSFRERKPYTPYFLFNEEVRSSYALVAVDPVMHDRDGKALRKFMKENKLKPSQIAVDKKSEVIDQFTSDKDKLENAKKVVAERKKVEKAIPGATNLEAEAAPEAGTEYIPANNTTKRIVNLKKNETALFAVDAGSKLIVFSGQTQLKMEDGEVWKVMGAGKQHLFDEDMAVETRNTKKEETVFAIFGQ